jgi:hypothetical protein
MSSCLWMSSSSLRRSRPRAALRSARSSESRGEARSASVPSGSKAEARSRSRSSSEGSRAHAASRAGVRWRRACKNRRSVRAAPRQVITARSSSLASVAPIRARSRPALTAGRSKAGSGSPAMSSSTASRTSASARRISAGDAPKGSVRAFCFPTPEVHRAARASRMRSHSRSARVLGGQGSRSSSIDMGMVSVESGDGGERAVPRLGEGRWIARRFRPVTRTTRRRGRGGPTGLIETPRCRCLARRRGASPWDRGARAGRLQTRRR